VQYIGALIGYPRLQGQNPLLNRGALNLVYGTVGVGPAAATATPQTPVDVEWRLLTNLSKQNNCPQ